ncbi:hypothetical protein H7R52_01840 [Weissella confusa]|uniref:Uncharacterized protein n=1 Tax=Weissella confusa TaxID=1583 RepID=A0A923NF01_WEICO|nr:hypothetical protein [Weissella confusa]
MLISVIVAMAQIVLSGQIVPSEFLNATLATIARFLPTTYAAQGYDALINHTPYMSVWAATIALGRMTAEVSAIAGLRTLFILPVLQAVLMTGVIAIFKIDANLLATFLFTFIVATAFMLVTLLLDVLFGTLQAGVKQLQPIHLGSKTINHFVSPVASKQVDRQMTVADYKAVFGPALLAFALFIGALLIQMNERRPSNGAQQLAGGASQLSAGVNTLAGKVPTLLDALHTASSGAQQLATGDDKLNEGVKTAVTGTKTLNDEQQLAAKMPSLYTGLGQANVAVAQLASGASQVATGNEQLANKTPNLVAGVGQLSDGLNQLQANTPALQMGTNGQLATSGALQAIDKFSTQVNQIASQLDGAVAGADKLASSAEQLSAGALQVQTGLVTLSGGLDLVDDPQFQTFLNDSHNAEFKGKYMTALQQVGTVTDAETQAQQVGDALTPLVPLLPQLSALLPSLLQGQATNAADLQKLTAGLNQLNDGLGQISKGTKGLSLGDAGKVDFATNMANLKTDLTTVGAGAGAFMGLNQLASNTPALVAGAKAASDGVVALGDGAKSLTAGATKVASGNQQLAAGAQQLSTQLSAGLTTIKLPDGVSQLQGGSNRLATGASTLADGIDQASTGIDRLADGGNQLRDSVGALPAATQQLASGSSQVASAEIQKTYNKELLGSIKQLSDGTAKAAAGTKQLNDGMGQLASGSGEVNRNLHTLASGLGEIQTGANGQAKRALADGDTLMTVTLPKDFTANTLTALSAQPKTSNIKYEVSKHTNYIGGILADTVTEQLKSQVSVPAGVAFGLFQLLDATQAGGPSSLKVAVVNADQPVKHNGAKLAVGQKVVDKLRHNDSVAWEFMSGQNHAIVFIC